MSLTETQKGDFAILINDALWGIFPVLTIISFSSFAPVVSLAWSTMFSCLFFGVIVVFKGRTRELLNPIVYKYIFFVVFTIGWLYYGLYFSALKFTTAGNASIIALMELFFSYLLFNVWKKQEFSALHTFGAVLMLIGSVIILFPKQGLSFHGGDFMILLASACAPIGNYYQQKLRKITSSETILFLRGLFAFPFFFLVAYYLKVLPTWHSVFGLLWLLALNGVIVLGLSKLFWLEGIHRISVTKANALSSASPLFTLIFAYFILHQSPTFWQLFSFIPLVIGLLLLTYQKNAPENS